MRESRRVKTEAVHPDTPVKVSSPHHSRTRMFLRYWLPVLLWMLLIFGMSTNAGAPRNTSRIIGPVLRWLNPGITDETISQVQFVIRKCAHVTEYAVLAVLLWRARRRPVAGDARPWRCSEAGFALMMAALFAASDEWHQSFVPTREGRFQDVFIDSAGALAGLTVCWWIGRRRGKW